MTQDHTRKKTVFLSHASKDKAFVERLADDLSTLGIGVWFDKWEIKVGDSIVDKINQGISGGDYLAVVLSVHSVKAPWVNRELNAAVIKELQQRSVFILPILLEPCNVPLLIADKKYADFSKDYNHGLEDLLAVFQMSFPEAKLTFEELQLSDDSNGATKRYSANILVSPDAPKPLIKEIVYKATRAVRARTYYANESRRQRFGSEPADVVWLYVYQRLEDAQLANWVCHSSWISPDYVDAPSTLHVAPCEVYKDVRIQFRVDSYGWTKAVKEDFLPLAQRTVIDTERILESARPLIRGLTIDSAGGNAVVEQLRHYGSNIRQLYFTWDRRPNPPFELAQLDSAVAGLMTFADNIFLPFSEQGVGNWDPKNRVWLAQDALRHYEEELATVRVLLKLVR